ncbi:MAG: DUF423 domain-containing protein [Caulobacteraceae bacterium]|nr:DUF423 domain-containing protein [Caulobacteraceae bacterium]
MTARPRALAALAAACGFLAVAAGAFGAHGIEDPTAKSLLHTGGEYGLIHALAVFAALFVEGQGGRGARVAAWLFLVGGTVFAVSLYLLALTGVRWLGAITPVGGLGMLAGWLVLGFAAVSERAR